MAKYAVILCTCFVTLLILTGCYHQASKNDYEREGLGSVNFLKKDISEDSFILEAKVVPHLGESTASLVNRARDAADFYANDECKRKKCNVAAQISGHQGSEAFAARTWTFVYRCYECVK
jgi:hypothetical protein